MESQMNMVGSAENTAAVHPGLTKVIRTGGGLTFSDALKAKFESHVGITFSRHAMERLETRGLTLGTDEMARLGEGVELERSKGCDDTLVLMEDLAFIVSIENNTVVTVMSGDAIQENVFTNIDSAVIA